ncbi:hypothetical protein predicted by Glimmer/Critica [Neisseria meningitidis WUE 2594]|nr:hypothetical protein predicted by Glimmer/Critica [Neisseria meningitidis WUE 2594]
MTKAVGFPPARKVTVSANATEKDSVFGDAVHIVIAT